MNASPCSGPIRVSVALVTRNRPEALRRCLESVRAQTSTPFEIVVSDDSEPEIASQIQAIAQHAHATYIAGPRRGLYANRNHAAIHCHGTHIRTMDDDHVLAPDHLARCLEFMEIDPFSIWTLGEVSFLRGEKWAVAETANQLHPSGAGCKVSNPDDNWSIADGSTFYPRAVFSQGWRMVEDFAYGASYLEFGALLYANGYRSRCLRGPLVEHHLEEETLTRGATSDSTASRLFASLCYNLFFRPNPIRAVRYVLAGLYRGGLRLPLILALPRLVLGVRGRWGTTRPARGIRGR